MIEDPALTLKKLCDSQKHVDVEEAQDMLNKSPLVNKLLTKPKQNPDLFTGIRAYEWRLLELAEIPFAGSLNQVKDWISLIIDKTYTPEGFSLTGKREGMLACHNAMITTVLLKLGYEDKTKIDTGINWILKYQSVDRNTTCTWTGKDLYIRFGGCMKKTPCYYGVVKSMKALSEYQNKYGKTNEITEKLDKGLEYILKEEVYKRLSNGEPIEDSIVKNFYPFSYKSNILEILMLLKSNNLFDDPRCNDAISIIKDKKDKNGYWKAEISQMKSAWIDFDPLSKEGLWISYMMEKLLS